MCGALLPRINMTATERIDIFFTLTGIGVVLVVISVALVAYFVIRAARATEKVANEIHQEVVLWRRREADALNGIRFAGKWAMYTIRNFIKG